MKKKIVLHVVESLAFGGVESHMGIVGAMGNLSRFGHTFCVISQGGAVSARMVLPESGRQNGHSGLSEATGWLGIDKYLVNTCIENHYLMQ